MLSAQDSRLRTRETARGPFRCSMSLLDSAALLAAMGLHFLPPMEFQPYADGEMHLSDSAAVLLLLRKSQLYLCCGARVACAASVLVCTQRLL
jgi:hypothetical protein